MLIVDEVFDEFLARIMNYHIESYKHNNIFDSVYFCSYEIEFIIV
jgi:hypothetical protein